jgi:hypothetical protein
MKTEMLCSFLRTVLSSLQQMINAIYEAHAAGTYMVTIDQVKSVIKHYNEEATAQDCRLYDLTLEEVMASKKNFMI